MYLFRSAIYPGRLFNTDHVTAIHICYVSLFLLFIFMLQFTSHLAGKGVSDHGLVTLVYSLGALTIADADCI